jgi:RNA polymerase sigma factor (sigma-70 family)
MARPAPIPLNQDEHGLLTDAQAYLQQRLTTAAPDSLLCLRWEQFYRTYDEILRHFSASLHLGKDDREEVVQMVWCQIVTSLAKFEWNPNRGGLRSYLYVMLRNKATDIIRERHEGCVHSLSYLPQEETDLINPDPSPLSALEKQFQLSLVETVLAELKSEVPELSYRVFHLRAVEGQSVEEVVAALGLETQSVWQRYHRVLQKVRLRVKLYGGEGIGLGE